MADEFQAQVILSKSMLEAQHAQQKRAQQLRETRDYIHQVQTDMREHRDQTQAKIRNEHYLNITGQEEYVNPICSEIDLGSNEWNHRWVTPMGMSIFPIMKMIIPTTSLADGCSTAPTGSARLFGRD